MRTIELLSSSGAAFLQETLMKSSWQGERVHFLSAEIVKLRKADETYRKKRSPSRAEVEAHRKREERLYKILGELAFLNKTKAASGQPANRTSGPVRM